MKIFYSTKNVLQMTKATSVRHKLQEYTEVLFRGGEKWSFKVNAEIHPLPDL